MGDPILREFPGAIRIGKLSESELQSLTERIEARGLHGHNAPARAVSEAAELDAYCQWLSSFGLDLIGVVTFTDDYAQRHGITSLSRATSDVLGALRNAHFRRGDARGYRKGFPFSYVLSAEWHRTGRLVPHVHVALESRGANTDRLCRELRGLFDGSRGRSRFEVMRDTSAATLYGLKDTIKEVKRDSEAIYLRLLRARDRSSKVLSMTQAAHGEVT